MILIYLGTRWYKSKIKDPRISNYFAIAVTLKVIGAISMVVIYRFYYQYGDTLSYYAGCKLLTQHAISDPGIMFKTLFSMPSNFDQEIYDFIGESKASVAFRADSNFMVVKFGTFFNMMGLNSILVTNMLFAFFSTFGIWKLYLVFYKKYPHLHTKLAFSILFIPSLFFWGSGLLKDTISLCFLGFLFYYLNEILYSRFSLKALFLLGISVYIILIVKSYIIFSIIPPTILLIYLKVNKQITNKLIRIIAVPVLLSISLLSFYLILSKATEFDDKYAVENIIKTAEGTKNDILHNSSEGASYSLGDTDYTPTGLLKVAPAAINVTLFRPYLFEARNPVMLLSALENTIILYLFVVTLFNIRKNWRLILKDELLMFSILFSIFFAFAVGFSTYNFGTLVRYKIPCVPFFVSFLVVVRYKYQKMKST